METTYFIELAGDDEVTLIRPQGVSLSIWEDSRVRKLDILPTLLQGDEDHLQRTSPKARGPIELAIPRGKFN